MKNKTNKVAAIKYDINDNAPIVTAKGKGIIGDSIINKAKENNVPIYKDEVLIESLSKIEIGEEIPVELYDVVSQILIFVNDLDKMEAKINERATK